jgi:hypothetical protein
MITHTEEQFRILSDEEVLHWLSHNVGMLKDPKHQGEQDQKLLKMQISICTELMSRRNGARPEARPQVEPFDEVDPHVALYGDLYDKANWPDSQEEQQGVKLLKRVLSCGLNEEGAAQEKKASALWDDINAYLRLHMNSDGEKR